LFIFTKKNKNVKYNTFNMGGGLMQLVAYGAQDIYLTGQPQITFFKSVYRRHTNFAIESIQQTVNGSLNFGANASVTVSRNGDLLKRLWIEYSPLNMLSGVNQSGAMSTVAANLGHSLLEHMDLEIGGQLIDRHYGKWLTIWNYLTDCNSSGTQAPITENCSASGEGAAADSATNTSLARPTKFQRMSYNHKANTQVTSNSGAPLIAWVPMEFWFCRNPGLAVPLIALQYHEVKLTLFLNNYTSILGGAAVQTGNEFTNFKVYADYVYLDTTERRQFAQNAHEYLIDQLQINSNLQKPVINMSFNHPVKELVWAIPPTPVVAPTYTPGQSGPAGASSPPATFTQSTPDQPNNYKIILNGTDRFTERDINYFTRNQVWEAHTGFGSVLFPDCIGVYSFALRPEEHQPSGTCNFSRIDTAQLSRTVADTLDIYAVNYNVLRIMSGMGGLAYSN
jgi:hypothetical protein